MDIVAALKLSAHGLDLLLVERDLVLTLFKLLLFRLDGLILFAVLKGDCSSGDSRRDACLLLLLLSVLVNELFELSGEDLELAFEFVVLALQLRNYQLLLSHRQCLHLLLTHLPACH